MEKGTPGEKFTGLTLLYHSTGSHKRCREQAWCLCRIFSPYLIDIKTPEQQEQRQKSEDLGGKGSFHLPLTYPPRGNQWAYPETEDKSASFFPWHGKPNWDGEGRTSQLGGCATPQTDSAEGRATTGTLSPSVAGACGLTGWELPYGPCCFPHL